MSTPYASVIFIHEKHTYQIQTLMKQNITIFLALIFISTLFYNCSPVPITRVSLDNNDVGYWQKGTAIGEKVSDDVIVEMAFSHSDDDFVYFDVAFENTGEERILINPKEIQLFDSINGSKFNAMDPELQILNQEIRDSKRTANNKTFALVAGAALVAGTVAAVATADDDSGSGSNTSEDGDDDYYVDAFVYTDFTTDNLPPMSYSYFSQDPLLSTNIRALPDNNDVIFWKEFAFRKSTLFPDQRIRGLVAFLKNKYTKRSKIIIPMPSQELTFDFNHYEIKP